MSNAALVQEVIATPQITVVPPSKPAAAHESDLHPLLTVGVAMVLALGIAFAFVGSIVAFLALRHSGVMAA